MDDGGLKVKGQLVLYTNAYFKEEVELLADVLRLKFNLMCTLEKRGEDK
jgi:hypothetical protein